jgi:O-antigen/teichoic acid export membrane protein
MSLRRNTLFNLAGAVLPLGVSLVCVPLYLRTIGEARYGVLAMAWMLLGCFGGFDLGVGRATAHQVARLRASDPGAIARPVWTGLWINLALGLVGAAVMAVVGPLMFARGFSIPAELRAEAQGVWWPLVLAVPTTTLSTVLAGTLEGHERFDLANGLGVLGGLVAQVLPLTVARLGGPHLGGLVATTVACRFGVGVVAAFAACWWLVPTLARPCFAREHLGTVCRYGGWLSISWVLHPVLTMADRFAIGTMAGASAVGHYAIATSLVDRVQLVPASLARSLFPRFSVLSGASSRETERRSLLALTAVMTPMVGVGLVLLRPFLDRWVGPSVAAAIAPAGAILLVGAWFNALAYVPYARLQGQGRPDLTARFHLLEVGPYLFVLFVGLRAWGLVGAAIAITFREVLDAGLLFWAARDGRLGEPIGPRSIREEPCASPS